jgi:hypothetical protein
MTSSAPAHPPGRFVLQPITGSRILLLVGRSRACASLGGNAMRRIMSNAAIGALEIDGFEAKSPRYDDHVLESAGLRAEPRPFTYVGFPPPCNVADETAPNRP